MGQGKDHMKIRGIDHFGSPLIDPDLCFDGLTVWTVAVTAGIMMYFDMTAFTANAEINTESTSLTAHNGTGGLLLDRGLSIRR